MADLEITYIEDSHFELISQGFSLNLKDSESNRKLCYVLLRTLQNPETGKPLFTYQKIADCFGYKDRRNIQNYMQEFEKCDEDYDNYLHRKRKVDESILRGVASELRRDFLASVQELRERVNKRLDRDDLTDSNIRTALDQVSCNVIRKGVIQSLSKGSYHIKEDVILSDLFSLVANFSKDSDKDIGLKSCSEKNEDGSLCGEAISDVELLYEKSARYRKILKKEGLQIGGDSTGEDMIQVGQSEAVEKLLTPGYPVDEIDDKVVKMAICMSFYYWNNPLSRIGQWFGKSKSTIYNWVIGLALALWSVLRIWIQKKVKGRILYVDEKWLKIRKKWHYLIFAVDEETGIPLFHMLLPNLKGWSLKLFFLKLKLLGKSTKAFMTDGLRGYKSVIRKIFPGAKHLLCIFHHQQGVTRYVKENLSEMEEGVAAEIKKKMKKVVQTKDTRTLKRRLKALKDQAVKNNWNILAWIKTVSGNLEGLIPAIRNNDFPRTNNAIERFFREFSRFYKTRRGFHSMKSALKEIIFFLVVYLFTIQIESGKAPIEKIIPNANLMPFF